MKTTPEALKDLYVALGGELTDVADLNTSVEVLNAIAAKYEGQNDAILNPDAIENIAAVANNIGGGSFSIITFTMTNKQGSDGSVDMIGYGDEEIGYSFDLYTIDVGRSKSLTLPALYDGKAVLANSYIGGRDVYIDEASTGIEKVTDEESLYYNNYVVSDGANIIFYASY